MHLTHKIVCSVVIVGYSSPAMYVHTYMQMSGKQIIDQIPMTRFEMVRGSYSNLWELDNICVAIVGEL